MAYFAPYLDASGIHMPTYEDRLQDLLSAYRLEKLEAKVDKHNSVVERMYRLESRMDILEKNIRN